MLMSSVLPPAFIIGDYGRVWQGFDTFIGNIRSFEINLPGSRLLYTRDQFGQCRFSTAVRSRNNDKTVFAYRQADIAEEAPDCLSLTNLRRESTFGVFRI